MWMDVLLEAFYILKVNQFGEYRILQFLKVRCMICILNLKAVNNNNKNLLYERRESLKVIHNTTVTLLVQGI